MDTEHVAEIAGRLRAAGSVFAEDEATLLSSAAGGEDEVLEAMLQRRCDGEPLELVIGWSDFCGIRVELVPRVFVPRHRTELLVALATALTRRGDIVVDLCCGSGAIAAAIASACAGIELHAADIDDVAVACAQRNLARFAAQVHLGDLFDALPPGLRGRVDLLCANVPYVPTAEIGLLPREARLYEPHHALDGGADGLEILRRVAAAAGHWLRPGGHLLTETGAHQAATACEILEAAGLRPQVHHDTEIDATTLVGRL